MARKEDDDVSPMSAPAEMPISGMDASMLLGGADLALDPVRVLAEGAERAPGALEAALAFAGSWQAWLAILAGFGLLVAIGWVASRLARRLTRGIGERPGGGVARILLADAAFVVAGVLCHWLLPLDGRSRAVALVLFLAVAFVAAGVSLAASIATRRFGEAGRSIVPRAALVLSVIAVGYVLLGLMRLTAAPIEARLTVGLGFWVVMLLAGIACLARTIRLIADADVLRGAGPDAGPSAVGAQDPLTRVLWHHPGWFFGLVLALIGASTVIFAFRQGPTAFLNGTAALLLLAFLPCALAMMPLPPSSGTGRSLRVTLLKCARLLAFVVFWLLLALLLDVNLVAMASERFGDRVSRVLIDVAVAIGLAYLLWELALAGLDALLHAESAHVAGTQPSGATTFSRVGTFVPLLRNVIALFILGVTVMIVLSSFGVDIGPLLAGAGIVGIAIGFGSQALVKDVISGLFFLADDAFRLGEYVELGSAKGTVESISIRSLKLRHPRGAVYTVPFGDVGVVNNQSRDWAIVKLEFVVEFDTDLIKAKRAVRQIAADIAEHEEFSSALIAPVKFQGVRRMEPRGLVVGVKFTSKPGQQFALRREVYARVRDAFTAAGINFARPQPAVDGATPMPEA